MKKIAKLSLVAAMAVTAANAASLEEAIKNVDVSGKVYFETIANTNQAANGGTDTLSDIDVDVTFKSKVNDNVTAVVRVEADQEDKEANGAVTKQTVSVDNVYFSYVNGGLTANVGKQDMNTPNTDGEIGNGVLALYNAGVATFAGAYFYDHELEDNTSVAAKGNDIGVAAVLGSIGPVNAEAWYVNYIGSHYTAVLSTKVGPVNLGARYAQSDLDALDDDGKTLKLTASANFGPFGVNATYLTTDKDGAATVTDASSANTYELSQLGLQGSDAGDLEGKDATIWALGASYTMDAMKYQVDYADFESDVQTSSQQVEADELRFRATYTMSKNFKIMGTYSIYEEETTGNVVTENDSARLEAKYSF